MLIDLKPALALYRQRLTKKFKTDYRGKTVFFPFGETAPGYVLPSEADKNIIIEKLTRQTQGRALALLPSFLPYIIAVHLKLFPSLDITVPMVLQAAILVWLDSVFERKNIKQMVASYPVSHFTPAAGACSMTFLQRLDAMSEMRSTSSHIKMLIVSFFICLFSGKWLLIVKPEQENMAELMLAIGGLCLFISGRALLLRYQSWQRKKAALKPRSPFEPR